MTKQEILANYSHVIIHTVNGPKLFELKEDNLYVTVNGACYIKHDSRLEYCPKGDFMVKETPTSTLAEELAEEDPIWGDSIDSLDKLFEKIFNSPYQQDITLDFSGFTPENYDKIIEKVFSQKQAADEMGVPFSIHRVML